MKSQTSAPALLLLGLGLALLAGNSHAQEENCIVEALSKAAGPLGGRGGRAMQPLVTRIMEQFKTQNIPEKMEDMLKSCACSEESPNATEAELCKCIAEMKECEAMHMPNSTTPQKDIKAKVNEWMDCYGEPRMAATIVCRDNLFSDPTQMICEGRRLKCSQEE